MLPGLGIQGHDAPSTTLPTNVVGSSAQPNPIAISISPTAPGQRGGTRPASPTKSPPKDLYQLLFIKKSSGSGIPRNRGFGECAAKSARRTPPSLTVPAPAPVASINNLPVEILALILRFVTSPEHTLKRSGLSVRHYEDLQEIHPQYLRVCKGWHRIARHQIWEQVVLHGNASGLRSSLERAQRLKAHQQEARTDAVLVCPYGRLPDADLDILQLLHDNLLVHPKSFELYLVHFSSSSPLLLPVFNHDVYQNLTSLSIHLDGDANVADVKRGTPFPSNLTTLCITACRDSQRVPELIRGAVTSSAESLHSILLGYLNRHHEDGRVWGECLRQTKRLQKVVFSHEVLSPVLPVLPFLPSATINVKPGKAILEEIACVIEIERDDAVLQHLELSSEEGAVDWETAEGGHFKAACEKKGIQWTEAKCSEVDL